MHHSQSRVLQVLLISIVAESVASRFAVVTLISSSYMNCGLTMLRSVRGSGRWEGDVLVIGSDGIEKYERGLYANYSARFVKTSSLYVPVVAGGKGVGPLFQYAKIQILVDPRFRAYSRILFLDADTVVQKPIAPLFKVALPPQTVIYARTNGKSIRPDGKHSLYTEFMLNNLDRDALLLLESTYPNQNTVFASNYMMLDLAEMPHTHEIQQRIHTILEKYQKIFKFNDQGLLNLLFYGKAAVVPHHGVVFSENGEIDLRSVVSSETQLLEYCKSRISGLGFDDARLSAFRLAMCVPIGNSYIHDYKKTCKQTNILEETNAKCLICIESLEGYRTVAKSTCIVNGWCQESSHLLL